ncbi:hypothetical protein GJ496_010264 [Pomphorhynchus laevis]|nr:hypothetical protein GJ496_010264 [Pomphorhynchus laevis]
MDKPFWRRKEELFCQFGVVMWLQIIVIPKTLRCHTLSLLYEGHPGERAGCFLARQLFRVFMNSHCYHGICKRTFGHVYTWILLVL